MGISVTGINTKLTRMTDIVQRARRTLKSSNLTISFSSRDTRRIVLLCLLLYFDNNCNNVYVSLYDVLERLHILNRDVLENEVIHKSKIITLSDTFAVLSELKEESEWSNYIIYAFESFEYDVDEYFLSKINRGIRNNKTKKNNGIYYTPDDVVSYMAHNCVVPTLNRVEYPQILDCSCGSGVFLLKCLMILDTYLNPQQDLHVSLGLLEHCIWGVDISESAVDSCRIALAKYYVETYENVLSSFDAVWDLLKQCIVKGDATKLGSLLRQHESFPKRFDCVIGNPPYISEGSNGNRFIDFVYNLIEFSNNRGCSSLVLPLSISYSSNREFVELRATIQNDKAEWKFLSFDRSPDSLFGDQVKTRNTIVFRNAISSQSYILTTGLIRWTSEQRNQLFEDLSFCNITEIDIHGGIPKLSTDSFKTLYKAICSGTDCIMNCLSKTDKNDNLLLMNGTAYNWLCIYDHIPPSTDELGNSYLSSSAKLLYALNEKDKYFIIALLSNRVAYWYWMTTGDGFHLNISFLKNYGLGKARFTDSQYDDLCKLGFLYSNRVKEYPTKSGNAGKVLVNYSHWAALDVVRRIESIILSALDLSEDVGESIENWYDNQVRCNRNIEE